MQNADWLKIKEIFYQTLDLPAKERDRFLAEQEEHVRAEVAELIASHEKAENFINEPAPVELGFDNRSMVDKEIGGYKIVEQLGAGGMGTVFLAEKEGLEKRVALKVIKRGMDTDAVLRRFVLERKILSRLEHPFIARLLDGGTTDDGLPFFVMEYVEGTPVTRFCDEHRFDIKERLELFRQICAAVAYSHQNLIVHRDLKPSNILITKDGTPKLLDFGIAKLLDTEGFENTATATQGRIFTPEYASPEQLSGAPITTASDVYSLGVVLYELLTGTRPFQTKNRNYQEIANAVLTEEPAKPSAISNLEFQILNPKNETGQNIERPTAKEKTNSKFKIQNSKFLKGDLDNIILKALRKEAERRYVSVQEFSEDIRRYLTGLPVSATADSRVYRFSKFVKRNKIVTMIAVVILLLSGVAVWQAVVATRERTRADARFRQVRKLANSLLFEYHDGIERLPGSTAVREKMVKDALEYLDNLSAESDDDASLQDELAVAFQKVGDIQGNPYFSNLGDTNGALASYEKALSIRQKLIAAKPQESKTRHKLANVYGSIGDILWSKGENSDALENYRKALAIDEELLNENSSDLSNLDSVAFRRYKVGQSLRQMRDWNGALNNFASSLEIRQKLFAANAQNTDNIYNLATSYLKLGDVFNDTANYSEALKNHQKALEILEPLKNDGNDSLTQRVFALLHYRIALDKKELGGSDDALADIFKALALQKRLVEVDPKNEQFTSDLSESYLAAGNLFLKAEKYAEAAEYLQKSIDFSENILTNSPDNLQIKQSLAIAYKSLGDALSKTGNKMKAQSAYQKADE